MKILGWTPPQRPQWVKEIMKTPGHTKVQLLLLLILATSSVTSTSLLMRRLGSNTSVENISTRNESLEVEVGGLRLRVTGKHTTDLALSLKRMLEGLDAIILGEPSFRYIQPWDRQIMKKQDSSSSTMSSPNHEMEDPDIITLSLIHI